MEISAACIKELREQCGAGIMDCRAALMKTDGDVEKALEVLKEQGFAKAAKKADRAADQGLVEAYIHCGGRIGAMVEVNCETDFVARTDEFKELCTQHSYAGCRYESCIYIGRRYTCRYAEGGKRGAGR